MTFGYFGHMVAVVVAFGRTALNHPFQIIDLDNGSNGQQVALILVTVALGLHLAVSCRNSFLALL